MVSSNTSLTAVIHVCSKATSWLLSLAMHAPRLWLQVSFLVISLQQQGGLLVTGKSLIAGQFIETLSVIVPSSSLSAVSHGPWRHMFISHGHQQLIRLSVTVFGMLLCRLWSLAGGRLISVIRDMVHGSVNISVICHCPRKTLLISVISDMAQSGAGMTVATRTAVRLSDAGHSWKKSLSTLRQLLRAKDVLEQNQRIIRTVRPPEGLHLYTGLPVRKAMSSTSWSLMVGSRENAAPPVPGPPNRSCTLILSH